MLSWHLALCFEWSSTRQQSAEYLQFSIAPEDQTGIWLAYRLSLGWMRKGARNRVAVKINRNVRGECDCVAQQKSDVE